MLRRGQIPIFEPGLEELVSRNRVVKRLTFTTQIASAVRASSIIFIAVGTPQGEDGSADLQQVLAVAREIARAMNGYKVIVDKSTVPVGTAERVREVIRRETTHPFSVVSNPEFLKQGAAVDDFMKPDRVVIGAEDPRAAQLMVDLYAPFTRTGAPVMVMDCASAEMCKYAANAMLATKISFMNEVARVCELYGANIDQVRRAVGSDRRIGPAFLFPGVGYGGSCFPKDVQAILKFSARPGLPVRDPGRRRARQPPAEGAAGREDGSSTSVRSRAGPIAVWGLAFKPKTDDMREAPSITIVEKLLEAGAIVRAYDPEAMKVAARIFGNRVTLVKRELRRAGGRRSARAGDRVERVPRAGLRQDAQAHADARSCSTAATSTIRSR